MNRLWIIATAVLPSAVHAQTDTSARLMGTANASSNGGPLSGVMIAVPSLQRFVVTDSTGTFWFSGLPAGPQMIRVAYEGRATQEYEVTLRSGRTQRIKVILDVEAVDLDPIIVDAKAVRGSHNFYDRMRLYSGFGRFFTRDDIEGMRPTRISDVLRRDGVWIRCNPDCVPTRVYRGYLCAVPVIVDGQSSWDFDFDNMAVADVAGIEVYRPGPGGRPFGFEPRSLVDPRDVIAPPEGYEGFRSRGGCGAIYIWTR